MKSLYLIPLLTVSLILSSCFGSKEEAPEPESPQEPVASTPAENEATKPAGSDDAVVDSSATGSAATESSEGSSSPSATSDAPAGSAAPAPDSASSEGSNTSSEPPSASSTPGESVAAAEGDPAMDENPVVTVSTSAGNITIELFAKESPQSVANFLSYAKEGYYENTVFHRVIEGFMVQGGGFELLGDGVIKQKETKAPVQNEAKNGVKNARGTIAMARTSAPHSATSQFFINHADNANLDYPSFDGWGYTVFGKVTEGMDVVDAIAAKPTSKQSLVTKVGPRPMDDVPNETIVIKSVTIAE